MAEPSLTLLDSASGQVVPIDAARNEHLERIVDVEQDLANAERELRKLRKRVATLEAEKERDRLDYIKRAEVEAIFVEWQEVAGKGRSKLDGERFDAIRGRLEEGYTRMQFTMAIQGGVYDPFVTEGKNGRKIKHLDIELICRTAKRFEAAAIKAPRTGCNPQPQTNQDDG